MLHLPRLALLHPFNHPVRQRSSRVQGCVHCERAIVLMLLAREQVVDLERIVVSVVKQRVTRC